MKSDEEKNDGDGDYHDDEIQSFCSDSFVWDKEKDSEYRQPDGLAASEAVTTSPLVVTSNRSPKSVRHTFRSSMSGPVAAKSTSRTISRSESHVENDRVSDTTTTGTVSMTPRQREFFDEQEKIKNAQFLIDKKNDMNPVLYFIRNQVIPHIGAISAWYVYMHACMIFHNVYVYVYTCIRIRDCVSVSVCMCLFLKANFN
jgi:hypothetical protein